jgi:hydrogenase nickel incorporation protein HypB
LEIKIVKSVLEKNKKLADNVRVILRKDNQVMFNFMSSPGAGKTLLLENLVPKLLKTGLSLGIIEGDVATLNDSLRLQHLGVPIVQINTEKLGGLCHLGSNTVLAALEEMNQPDLDIIIVENIGNLICPGESDTGADVNIVMLSTTEGEDKPLKYPRIFLKSDLAIISKIDIAEAIGADVSLIEENILKVNPKQKILQISAKKQIGLDSLVEWMLNKKRSIF